MRARKTWSVFTCLLPLFGIEIMNITYVTETFPPEINGVALTVARTVQYLRHKAHSVDLIRPHQAHEKILDIPGEWRTAGIPIPMYPELRIGWGF